MGLMDIASTVLTKYKADASDHISEIKSLKGVQDDLRKSMLDAATERNQQFGDWIKSLNDVKVALEASKQVVEFVFSAWKESIHEVRLEYAAAGVDMNALGQAAGGLKTKLELLEFAGRVNRSEFHLTTNEMMQVEQGMRALTERGFSAAQVQDAFTTALVTGRTRGLEPMTGPMKGVGETVDQLTDKLSPFEKRQQGVNNVLQAAAELAKEAGHGMGTYGEEGEAAIVQLTDAWHDFKNKIGEVVEELAPAATAFASIAKHLLDIAATLGKIELPKLPAGAIGAGTGVSLSDVTPYLFGGVGGTSSEVTGHLTDALKKQLAAQRERADEQMVEDFKRDLALGYDVFQSEFGEFRKAFNSEIDKASALGKEAGRKAAEEQKKALEEANKSYNKTMDEWVKGYLADVEEDAFRAGGSGHIGYVYNRDKSEQTPDEMAKLGAMSDRIPDMKSHYVQQEDVYDSHSHSLSNLDPHVDPKMDQLLDKADALMAKERGQTALNKIFGPIEEFHLYNEAFKGLQKASEAAFNAWIEGSESAGTAFKKAIGKSIEALADQMLVRSISEAAWAIGDLAIGNLAGAEMHGIAAAEFAAGALVAGTLAHEMGTSWGIGSAPSASSGGAGSGTGGANDSGGTSSRRGGGSGQLNNGPPVIIVYGDAFASDNPLQRQRDAERIVNAALGGQGGRRK